MKIAIVDTLGLTFDGSTLNKRGLGGSESAVIMMARELSKLNLDVSVYNDCTSDESKPGVYDNVQYIPLKEIEHIINCDIMVASRSVAAFAPPNMKERFKTFVGLPDFTAIQRVAKHKILWIHDTFCDGDDLIEDFIREGRINEVFTLSDWHSTYVMNCDHGNGMKRRNFDILKHHFFQTRNGIGKYHSDWIDVRDKDPNLFVYNASVTKGMVPLVNEIWPKVKQQIPQAKLKVIGGYYKFREGSQPDAQELQWRDMVAKYPDIDFTGIISQKEITDILKKASFMLYPAGFPETFGISTLEALAHNVPLITCRFGALEETALDEACWKLDYPVEPNWALPWLNREDQVNKFVDLTLQAYNNKYLHQQKMYVCNRVKNICYWDSVALQWKQHFYKKLGAFLPVEEYRAVQKINKRVHEVFGRRFYNEEERQEPRNPQKWISIATTVYNAQDYIKNCILSVAQQDYDKYTMFITNDASTDNTANVIKETIASLPKELRTRFIVVHNEKNVGAVKNQNEIFKVCADGIIMILDGDDWLINNPELFHKYNNLYEEGAQFTYGSCWSLVDNIPLIAQEYPPEIKSQKKYREYKFNWNMPYTHLRTFHTDLLSKVDKTSWQDEKGNWLRAGGDTAIFYSLIEVAVPNKVICVPDIVYNYNDANPLNDYKINGEEQTRTANKVLGITKSDDKFSVIMPTMWRIPDMTEKLVSKLQACDLVDEIIIIDNDIERFPAHFKKWNQNKLKFLCQPKNIGVNPAWNLGVKTAKNNRLCIVNDDIIFDAKVFEKLQDKLFEGAGPYGAIYGDLTLGQPETINHEIDFVQWKLGDCIHPFGQLFFIDKRDWVEIPSDLIINYGDEWVMHTQRLAGNPIHLIYNFSFVTTPSSTVSDPTVTLITEELRNKERQFWDNYMINNPVLDRKKKILIAIPTARYIEPTTFKAIYDLEIPEGYETEFQFFYGYQVDQVRNLIADWVIKGYDYLFAVDHDISFAPDTLKKLLAHDKDYVCGIYRQRFDEQILEVHDRNLRNIPYEYLHNKGLVEIGGSGFGCVLVNKAVFETVGYPQFEYHSAIDHKDTFSEDVDFCKKAREKGFQLWCDTSILCEHRGERVFKIEPPIKKENPTTARFQELRNMNMLPLPLKEYMQSMNIKPRIIYDIGSCILDWADCAKEVWPNSQIFLFEGMKEVKEYYIKKGYENFHLGILTDTDLKQVKYYKNLHDPGGNSIYKENIAYSPNADLLFPDEKADYVLGLTLDTVVRNKKFPSPDLIKIDTQGSELDILQGAELCLRTCRDLIIECQHVEYNTGAPTAKDIAEFLTYRGFNLIKGPIDSGGFDGDYHFSRG